jgi:hypothetical protein
MPNEPGLGRSDLILPATEADPLVHEDWISAEELAVSVKTAGTEVIV